LHDRAVMLNRQPGGCLVPRGISTGLARRTRRRH
jgi:hypothetical protein